MKLPVVSGSEAVKALRKFGFELDEQQGNHLILRHVNPPHRRLSVPGGGTWGRPAGSKPALTIGHGGSFRAKVRIPGGAVRSRCAIR